MQRIGRAFGLAAVVLAATAWADDQRPGLPPLTELERGSYHGYRLGLYPGGSNQPDAAAAEALARATARITPRDPTGEPDGQGKIGFVSIGASTGAQISDGMIAAWRARDGAHPAVVLVNGCAGGQDLNKIADPQGRYWHHVASQIAAAGITPEQVQVVWYQEDDLRDTRADFPGRPQMLAPKFAASMRLLKQQFPHLQICYHSARHTTALGDMGPANTKHAEPRAYFNGWAVKWLIERQLSGDAELRFEGDDALAPLVTWARYFWTEGELPRGDGYQLLRDDVSVDAVHLTSAGRQRIGADLFDFFATDSFARRWLLAAPDAEVRPAPVAGPPQWIVNGNDKIAKLGRLLPQRENVRVVVKNLAGETVLEIADVFEQQTNLNQRLGPGQYRVEFYDAAGERLPLQFEVGEILRLK